MKTIHSKSWVLALTVLVMLWFAPLLSAKDPYTTGLPELTEQELKQQNKHMKKVKKIKLNKLGLERINQSRLKKGQAPLDPDMVSAPGTELEVMVGEAAVTDPSFPLAPMDMPGYVDNSLLKYFPPIRSQGSLNSCGVFSGAYYAMTHMYAMAKDLDAKNAGDDVRLSPKWAYNMVNGGTNAGSWYYWAYEIGQKHGISTWAEFPYDANYRAWNLNPSTWENAIYRKFDQYGYVMDTHKDSGIDQVKQMLLNGYVLNIPTYINSWSWLTIGNDPSTNEDDLFSGKKCVAWVNGTAGYHAMTVVGYNDHIWVDINQNNLVDAGEKGAFRIANSWGTGWGEAGFAWMSYDALKNPSAVPNGPSTNRIYGWSPSRAHWVTAKPDYQPRLLGKFTLNHATRDHLRLSLGVSGIDQTQPSQVWIPEMIYNQGGAYGFSGTTAAVPGTFVFDFTDLLPPGGGLNTYYLGVQDDTLGQAATLESFVLIDVANGNELTPSLEVPQTIDGVQAYATLDYTYFDGNLAPTALAEASIVSGQAPLMVVFDGTASHDPDGSIVSFLWDFGDGASQSGAEADHLYDRPGLYTATLTVTDDQGATDVDTLEIEVMPDPSKQVFVSKMQATLVSRASRKYVKVVVEILDTESTPVSGARVLGSWSGLLSGEVSATTQSNGTLLFTSATTKKSGIITFTIHDVIASGYSYDPSLNLASSIRISTDGITNETVNQSPVATIQATQVSGMVPLEVGFDSLASHDPDGVIISYEWDLGDGVIFQGERFDHVFDSPGIHAVTLTVTDDAGAVHKDQVTIQVDSGFETSMYVADITMDLTLKGSNANGLAMVTLVDDQGNPVESALVSGTWSGLVQGSQSGVTGQDGSIVFTSPKTKKSGSFLFTIHNITKPGFIYTHENNRETEDSIDIP